MLNQIEDPEYSCRAATNNSRIIVQLVLLLESPGSWRGESSFLLSIISDKIVKTAVEVTRNTNILT